VTLDQKGKHYLLFFLEKITLHTPTFSVFEATKLQKEITLPT